MRVADVVMDRHLMGLYASRANVNRDLEGRTISSTGHLVTFSMSTGGGNFSVMSAFTTVVPCAEINHGEIPVVKCNNISKACKKEIIPSVSKAYDL
jgi:hypothetical protein